MKNQILYSFIFSISCLLGQDSSQFENPRLNIKDSFVNHVGYSVSYNQKFRQANWVAYHFTKTETSKLFDRQNKFIANNYWDFKEEDHITFSFN